MTKQNQNNLTEKMEEKWEKRDKKKKVKMKVSGGGVKKLLRIIKKK